MDDKNKKHVSTLIRINRGFYIGVPADVVRELCAKRGDKFALFIEGRTLLYERIPWEEIADGIRAARAAALRGAALCP